MVYCKKSLPLHSHYSYIKIEDLRIHQDSQTAKALHSCLLKHAIILLYSLLTKNAHSTSSDINKINFLMPTYWFTFTMLSCKMIEIKGPLEKLQHRLE